MSIDLGTQARTSSRPISSYRSEGTLNHLSDLPLHYLSTDARVQKDDKPKADLPKSSVKKTPTVKDVAKPTEPAPAPKPAPEPAKPAVVEEHHHHLFEHHTEERKSSRLWRSETERLQWEMTERALAKNDDGGPFRHWGRKIGEHYHEMKDKYVLSLHVNFLITL